MREIHRLNDNYLHFCLINSLFQLHRTLMKPNWLLFCSPLMWQNWLQMFLSTRHFRCVKTPSTVNVKHTGDTETSIMRRELVERNRSKKKAQEGAKQQNKKKILSVFHIHRRLFRSARGRLCREISKSLAKDSIDWNPSNDGAAMEKLKDRVKPNWLI